MKNYFDKLDKKVSHYKNKYAKHPRKAAAKLAVWNAKCIFKRELISDVNLNFIFSNSNKIRTLFILKGGLGDIFIALNYLKNFYIKFANTIVIDIFVPPEYYDSIKTILNQQNFINNCLVDNNYECSEYDLTLECVRIPLIKYPFNIKKIRQYDLNLYNWIKKTENWIKKNNEYTVSKTVNYGLLSQYLMASGLNRLECPDVIRYFNIKDLFRVDIIDKESTLLKFDLINNKYIVIQNGSGIFTKTTSQITRDWSNNNFNELIVMLRNKYPDCKIIQVGYSEQIALDVDINLLGKTSFSELLAIVGYAKILIASESGCIHFRHFTTTKPSVVLFGPTRPEVYGYPENINIVSPSCIGCEWYNNWRSFCVKTNSTSALCMHDITPEYVIKKLNEASLQVEGE